MTQPTNSPPLSPEEMAAQERARLGWFRLRQQISKIAPNDLARFLLVTVAIIGVMWLTIASWPALAPFVVGGFIAYMLLPIVNTLDRVLPRPIAALVTLAGFFALAFAIIAALTPVLAEQALRLYTNTLTAEKVSAARQGIIENLQNQPEPLRSLLRNYLQLVVGTLQTRLDAFLTQLAANNVSAALRVFSTFSAVLGLLVLPIWILAVVTGQRRAANSLRSLLPDWMEPDTWAVIRIVDRTLGAFLRGQLVLAIAVGVVLYLELTLLERLTPTDIRYPIVAALFAGLLQLIPQVGPLIGILLIFFLTLPAGIQFSLQMVGVYILAQIIVNQLVAGRVNRRVIDLNPALLAVVVTVLSEFGLIWVLLSAPILSITRDLFRYTYGRFGDPPRPANVLPGETAPPQAAAGQLVRSPPTSAEGVQTGRRPNVYGRNQSAR